MTTSHISTESKKSFFKKRGSSIFLSLFLGVTFAGIFYRLKSKGFLEKSNKSQLGSFSLDRGNILPEFQLNEMRGTPIKISELKGKVFFLNFWATWCGACMNEMSSLMKLRNTYYHQGFEVLGINLDENPESTLPRAIQRYGIQFPIFLDPSGQIADLFDVHGIPFTVVINQKRQILDLYSGDQNWDSSHIHSKVKKWLKD